MARRFDVPRLLVLGMSIAIAGSIVVAIAPEQITVRRVMVVAGLLLMAAGYALVARELSSWPRSLLFAVSLLQLAWVAWVIVLPLVPELDDWQYRLLAASLWWSGIVFLTVAARAWWRPATGWVVVAALLAVVLEALSWAPYLAPAFDAVVEEVPALEPWIRPLRELLTSVSIVVLVRGIQSGEHDGMAAESRR